MPKFKVTITETCVYELDIEAATSDDAEANALRNFTDSDNINRYLICVGDRLCDARPVHDVDTDKLYEELGLTEVGTGGNCRAHMKDMGNNYELYFSDDADVPEYGKPFYFSLYGDDGETAGDELPSYDRENINKAITQAQEWIDDETTKN